MTNARRKPNRPPAAVAILAFLLACAAGPAVARAQTDVPTDVRVRVYLVVDYQSGLPLAGLYANRLNIGGILGWADQFHPGTVTVFQQTDPQALAQVPVNPQGILDYYRDLPDVRPNDVLVFYYAGHGATDPRPGMGHWLSTSGGAILRRTIRKAMEDRKPRLAVLLTDCCSSVDYAQPLVVAAAPSSATAPDHLRKILDDLFLRSTGVTDWTAASFDPATRVGEYAWYNSDGGLFTSGFYSALNRGVTAAELDLDHDGFVSWAEFGADVGRTVDASYQRLAQAYLALDPTRLTDAVARETYFRIANQQHQTIQRFADGAIVRPAGAVAAAPGR